MTTPPPPRATSCLSCVLGHLPPNATPEGGRVECHLHPPSRDTHPHLRVHWPHSLIDNPCSSGVEANPAAEPPPTCGTCASWRQLTAAERTEANPKDNPALVKWLPLAGRCLRYGPSPMLRDDTLLHPRLTHASDHCGQHEGTT